MNPFTGKTHNVSKQYSNFKSQAKPAYPHFEQTKPVWKFTHYRQLLRVLAGKRLQKSGHVVTFWWLSNIFSGKFSHFFHEELTPPNTTSMLSPRCCWILPKCARKKIRENPALWASLPIISTHRYSRWIPCWRYHFRHSPLSSTQVNYFQAKNWNTRGTTGTTGTPVDVLFWLSLKSFHTQN